MEESVARRVWRKDETLWGGPGPEIGNRLGWLTISEPMLENAADLKEFAETAKSEGYTHAALLGMGGSSLGPEVIRRSYGDAGGLELHVLDSTDPGAVLELESKLAARQDRVHRVLEVGRDGGDAVAHEALLRAHRRQREAVRGRHRPRQRAGGRGREARLRAGVPERPQHRRPLLGAVVLRPGAGGLRRRGHRRAARGLARGRGELQRLRLHAVQLGAVDGPDDGRAGPAGPRQGSPSWSTSRSPASACGSSS